MVSKCLLLSLLTKTHIVLVREEFTVWLFPLIDTLGKSNIYRNVMV